MCGRKGQLGSTEAIYWIQKVSTEQKMVFKVNTCHKKTYHSKESKSNLLGSVSFSILFDVICAFGKMCKCVLLQLQQAIVHCLPSSQIEGFIIRYKQASEKLFALYLQKQRYAILIVKCLIPNVVSGKYSSKNW